MEYPYWNHNVAYYDWILRHCPDYGAVLDVGCGDGTLVRHLFPQSRIVIGLDPDPNTIEWTEKRRRAKAMILRNRFEVFSSSFPFDCIVFCASLHHMNMEAALLKAKKMLAPGGVLLVVGIASPSSFSDKCIELLRVIPSALVSKAHHMRSSVDIGLTVCYEYPTMNQVRATVNTILPGANIKYGLHFRYLLEWHKPQDTEESR